MKPPKEVPCETKGCDCLAIGAYKALPGDIPADLCAGCRDKWKARGVTLTKVRNHLKWRKS